jgi:hypothetical protein
MPRLRQVADIERATAKKARESWHMLTIMAEFIESTERLSEVRPAVSSVRPASSRTTHILVGVSFWRALINWFRAHMLAAG